MGHPTSGLYRKEMLNEPGKILKSSLEFPKLGSKRERNGKLKMEKIRFRISLDQGTLYKARLKIA